MEVTMDIIETQPIVETIIKYVETMKPRIIERKDPKPQTETRHIVEDTTEKVGFLTKIVPYLGNGMTTIGPKPLTDMIERGGPIQPYNQIRQPQPRDNYDRNRELQSPNYYDRERRFRIDGLSPGKNFSQERNRNRNRSQKYNRTMVHDNLKPGWNCAQNYRPDLYKLCRKCAAHGVFTHHEFNCLKYLRFNPNLCSSCKNGFHLESVCDTVRVSNNFTQDAQQTSEETKTDRIKELISLLDESQKLEKN